MTADLHVALVSIARPTFDVPLAQAVADGVLKSLEDQGIKVVGTKSTLIMDEAAAAQAHEGLKAADFDALILLQASFADSSIAVDLAQTASQRRIPIILWAVPDARDGGRLRLNSLCGINLAAHALQLRQIRYDYLHESPQSPQAISQISSWAMAGRTLRRLTETRIGLIGERPAGFDTCDFSADDLNTLFGVTVAPIKLEMLLQQAVVAPQIQRNAFVEQVSQYADNLQELDADAVNGTAGVYAALRGVIETHDLAGVAVRCWPEFFTELGCAACGAMSMLNEERCPASCEADVNGTLTSLLLQHLSGHSAFITDLVSVDTNDDTAVLWHCGLAPIEMADPAGQIIGTVHSNRKLPLLFEFPLKPGRVTVARLHRIGGATGRYAYQLVIGGGEMLRAAKSFDGTSGVIRFDAPANVVLDRIMEHGLEHHFNITYGDVRHGLRAIAKLLDIAVIELTD